MPWQNQMTNNCPAFYISILRKLTGTGLTHHFGNCTLRRLRIIPCVGKSSSQFRLHIFHIWQIYIHITIQSPDSFHALIPTGIVHDWKIHFLSSGQLQRRNNMRHIMRPSDQIQICRPFFLQFQKNFSKPLH